MSGTVYIRLGHTPAAVDWERFLAAVGDQGWCPAEAARELGLTLRKFRRDALLDPARQAQLDRALARRRIRRRLSLDTVTADELALAREIIDELLDRTRAC